MALIALTGAHTLIFSNQEVPAKSLGNWHSIAIALRALRMGSGGGGLLYSVQ